MFIQTNGMNHTYAGGGDRNRKLRVTITEDKITIQYWTTNGNKWTPWISKTCYGLPVKIKRCGGTESSAALTTFEVTKE